MILAGHQISSLFFEKSNFPFAFHSIANPPETLQNSDNKKWFNQEKIAFMLKDNQIVIFNNIIYSLIIINS